MERKTISTTKKHKTLYMYVLVDFGSDYDSDYDDKWEEVYGVYFDEAKAIKEKNSTRHAERAKKKYGDDYTGTFVSPVRVCDSDSSPRLIAHWLKSSDETYCTCSNCKSHWFHDGESTEDFIRNNKYCGYCGAKMEVDK